MQTSAMWLASCQRHVPFSPLDYKLVSERRPEASASEIATIPVSQKGTRHGLAVGPPESLAEEFQIGWLGRDLPGTTQQCWHLGGRIDPQGMEDCGDELA
jgi:hypothetical protein